jgi:hypothetical protein
VRRRACEKARRRGGFQVVWSSRISIPSAFPPHQKKRGAGALPGKPSCTAGTRKRVLRSICCSLEMTSAALCLCLFAAVASASGVPASASALNEDNMRGLCLDVGAVGDCRVKDVKEFSAKPPLKAPCCGDEEEVMCLPFHPKLSGKCVDRSENPFRKFLSMKIDKDGTHLNESSVAWCLTNFACR